MPRPQPLEIISSALPHPGDNGALTPRTPHSRTARLEGGFAKLQVSDGNGFEDDTFIGQHQSEPLLASSSTGRFPGGPASGKQTAAGWSSREPLSPLTRALLLFGVAVASALLLLIILSFTRRDVIHRVLGLHAPVPSHQQHQHHAGAHVISYENYTKFPLLGSEYLHECQKVMSGFMSHGDYWEQGHNHAGAPMDVDHFDEPNDNICNSTITYMLDGNVGLAADLALMAQAAALARERNRTFFVDDTYWTRGKWTDYFQDVAITQQGPEPGCSPAPPDELVACPRTARHWVVNSLTAKYHLGHAFENHYENSYGHDLNRAKPIFEHAEASFSSTIQPNEQMTNLINTAKQELLASISTQDPDLNIDEHNTAENDYISVHIRRGDRIPHGWEYHRKPIPIKEYVDAVLETAKRTQESDSSTPPVLYVASDSPAAIDEFTKSYHGLTFSLSKSVHSDVQRLSSPNEYHQDKFNVLSLEERRSLTKGALVDLALVTGLWDSGRDPHLNAAICSVSSNFCRLAAIGLGWDKAFGNVNNMGEIDKANKRWVDVDLKGKEIPVWQAFELF